jgi:hypothetical protein
MDPMTTPLDPPVLDAPPDEDCLTDYDRQHLVTYLRLLDAEAAGADWREVAKIVLKLDPEAAPHRARQVHAAHLRRAHWMTEQGYRQMLAGGRAGRA